MAINYTGVFLDDASRQTLHKKYFDTIPEDWKWSGDHMTIEYGRGAEVPEVIGKPVTLTVTQIGTSNDALALKVDGYKSKTQIAHITLAYKDKAASSNNITDWKDTDQFTLTGKVGILYYDGKPPKISAGRRKTRRAVKNTRRRRRA